MLEEHKPQTSKPVYPRKAKITMEGIDDQKIELEGRIVAEESRGFNTKYGGWAAYRLSEEDTPATFIAFIPKGKRKPRSFNLKNVGIQLLD